MHGRALCGEQSRAHVRILDLGDIAHTDQDIDQSVLAEPCQSLEGTEQYLPWCERDLKAYYVVLVKGGEQTSQPPQVKACSISCRIWSIQPFFSKFADTREPVVARARKTGASFMVQWSSMHGRSRSLPSVYNLQPEEGKLVCDGLVSGLLQ